MSTRAFDIHPMDNAAAPPPPYPGSDSVSEYDFTPIPHAQNRPRLPEEFRNPHLHMLPDDAKIVKFQTIVRENKEIVVGRIKIPTPGANPHAFILRRYDTNAISLTTMFKVAFPGADEDDEKRELEWIKSSYDIRNTNGGRGSNAVRLAGQWISRELAIHLAPAYGVTPLVSALARAVPDPNVAYRKSQRSQAASETVVPAQGANTGADGGSGPKRQRRRESDTSADPAHDGQRHMTLEATTTITAPSGSQTNMEAEIESAKQLVLNLKRELQLKAAAGEEAPARGTKRATNVEGDDDVAAAGASGSGDRVIKRNKRVELAARGETAHKVALGAFVFGLGMGAANLLPHLSRFFG